MRSHYPSLLQHHHYYLPTIPLLSSSSSSSSSSHFPLPRPPLFSITNNNLKIPFLLATLSRFSISSPTPRTTTTTTTTTPYESDDDEEEEEEKELLELPDEIDELRWVPPSHDDELKLQVIELADVPEQWRRSKIAWLCKELPCYRHSTFVRILNSQRKWITLDDATYITLHCMRIRDNESAFRVYSWMSQQHWYRFNFALTTKLADYLGKDRKIAKCRELFDAIIKQGRVPCESTFHILVVSYLSAAIDGSLEEACSVYNKMIQMGGYRPKLSLHNSLFRALLSQTGGTSKYNLRQAEFIYHNLVTSNLEVQKDIYAGLVWLHSYQDVIDRDRIRAIREEIKRAGFEEGKDILVSIMRASSKEGDVNETEAAWRKLLAAGSDLPPQAFVCRMELYARTGVPMKSLEIFKEMKEREIPLNVATYHKIIEVMAKAREIEIAEELMDEFIGSNMKRFMPAFLNLMCMYFDLGMHERVQLTFSKCITLCRPNRILCTIYLESLVRAGNVERAEEVFNEMQTNGTIGTNAKSCNVILSGYLAAGECLKAEKIYSMMRQKKYDIQPDSLEKLRSGLLILNKKEVSKTVSMQLDQEQREILVGLLLGGTEIESDEHRRNHIIHFKFNGNSDIQDVLKAHIHERFYEWLCPSSRSANEESDIPCMFSTVAHSSFSFYADQFFPKGRRTVPKLIHRWLSPRVLAYWFMLGGFVVSSGDIVLQLEGGSSEGVERIVKSLQAKSLASKVKRKGRLFLVGFQGSNAESFRKLVKPFVLNDSRDFALVQQTGKCDDSVSEVAGEEQHKYV